MTDNGDARPRGGEQQQERPEDTEKTMSEDNNTTTAEDEQNEYQVSVWAKRELTPRVTADNADEAEDEASEYVTHEYGVGSDDILVPQTIYLGD